MQKLVKNKKGQFYVLIALLLISYAFSLTRHDVPARKPRDTFQLLHEDYVNEGASTINNAVYEDANVTAKLAQFTTNYLAFARSAEPNFRLVYLLKYKDKLTVANRLDTRLNVTIGNTDYLIATDGQQTADAANSTVKLAGINYDFGFTQEDIQLKALFRISDKLSTRIFVFS